MDGKSRQDPEHYLPGLQDDWIEPSGPLGDINGGFGRWTPIAPTSAHTTATLLPNDKALLTGGSTNISLGDPFPLHNPSASSAELYDPANGAWTNTASMKAARAYHSAFLLPDPAAGMSATAFTSTPIAADDLEPAEGRVFVNGLPSLAQFITPAARDIAVETADGSGPGSGVHHPVFARRRGREDCGHPHRQQRHRQESL